MSLRHRIVRLERQGRTEPPAARLGSALDQLTEEQAADLVVGAVQVLAEAHALGALGPEPPHPPRLGPRNRRICDLAWRRLTEATGSP